VQGCVGAAAQLELADLLADGHTARADRRSVMRWILHDWSDDESVGLLKNVGRATRSLDGGGVRLNVATSAQDRWLMNAVALAPTASACSH
jgi:hypothetical protein